MAVLAGAVMILRFLLFVDLACRLGGIEVRPCIMQSGGQRRKGRGVAELKAPIVRQVRGTNREPLVTAKLRSNIMYEGFFHGVCLMRATYVAHYGRNQCFRFPSAAEQLERCNAAMVQWGRPVLRRFDKTWPVTPPSSFPLPPPKQTGLSPICKFAFRM